MSSTVNRRMQIERSTSSGPKVNDIAIQADCDEDDSSSVDNGRTELLNFSEPFLFSDAVLMVQGKALHCHRAMLSIYSPVFRGMFQSRWKENEKNEVIIPVDDYVDIKEMLRHMYTPGGCDMTVDSAERLIPILHRYQIDSLLTMAERVLTFRLNDASAPNYLRIASLFDLTRLKSAALESCARIDSAKLDNLFNQIALSQDLRNEVLLRRVAILEKCLIDISQTFTHSCARVESRTERVPSNHCPEHNRPLAPVKLRTLIRYADNPQQVSSNGITIPSTTPSATSTTTAVVSAGAIAVAAPLTTTSANVRQTSTTQTSAEGDLQLDVGSGITHVVKTTSAVCEHCVDQFKNHILELCKKGLHKIPIVTWPTD